MAKRQPVDRGEFRMLTAQVAENARRLDAVDASGTRGTVAAVGVVQVQLTDLAKDVAALTARIDGHEAEHDRTRDAAEREKTAARRWRVGVGVAALSATGGVYGLLALIIGHLH